MLIILGDSRILAATPQTNLTAGQDAVILEESLDIEFRSVSDARVQYRKLTKILSARGAKAYDSESTYYGPGVTIRKFGGKVILPSGKEVPVEKSRVVDSPAVASYELYSDARYRSILFPGVVAGATVEFSYEKSVSNFFYLERGLPLQEEIPARMRTLTVKVPDTLPLWISVKGASPQYVREQGSNIVTHRWLLHDVPALKLERHAPPQDDLLPRITIVPKVWTWGERPVNTASWDGVARFYWDLAERRMRPTADVEQMARSITADADGSEERLRRVFEFARDKVNYVAIGLDIGGWQPHASAEVLRNRYGDCKDKVTLMVAMLRTLGVESRPALIRTRNVGLLDEQIPSLSFNHAIVAVPMEGEFLFLDPTSESTSFGDLPWQDQGVKTLVVGEGGVGDLIATPLLGPDRNLRRFLVEAEIGAGGELKGRVTLEVTGQRRAELADLSLAGQREIGETAAELLEDYIPGAQLRSHEVLIGSGGAGEPLRLGIDFAIPSFLARAGTTEIARAHIVKLPALTSRAADHLRTQPLFFPYLSKDIVESRVILPPGRTIRKLPSDASFEAPGLEGTTHYELDSGQEHHVLVVRRTATVSLREIEPQQYAAVRAFVSSLADDEARAVTLQQAP